MRASKRAKTVYSAMCFVKQSPLDENSQRTMPSLERHLLREARVLSLRWLSTTHKQFLDYLEGVNETLSTVPNVADPKELVEADDKAGDTNSVSGESLSSRSAIS